MPRSQQPPMCRRVYCIPPEMMRRQQQMAMARHREMRASMRRLHCKIDNMMRMMREMHEEMEM